MFLKITKNLENKFRICTIVKFAFVICAKNSFSGFNIFCFLNKKLKFLFFENDFFLIQIDTDITTLNEIITLNNTQIDRLIILFCFFI